MSDWLFGKERTEMDRRGKKGKKEIFRKNNNYLIIYSPGVSSSFLMYGVGRIGVPLST